MIAKLKGLLDTIGDDWLIIDVNGVGYMVFCSGRTLSNLPGTGEALELHIETHVREDHIHLYGFASAEDRQWFNLLLAVQGVGAKVALAIQSTLSSDEIMNALMAQDKAMMARAPGVGPKLAGRIVSELKDKAGKLVIEAPLADAKSARADQVETSVGKASVEAISALVNLGYGQTDAFVAVQAAVRDLGPDAGLQDLIRLGLRELSR
jgi:Holliday junction DNA helicase RuvA